MNLRDLVALLSHELRTPLAAIIGYQELLRDGIYGELTPRQLEPVTRSQHSAELMLGLVDGLQALAAADRAANGEVVDTDTQSITDLLADRLLPMAAMRNVRLDRPGKPVVAVPRFPLQIFLRAAEIATMAAIKSSQGCTIALDCQVLDQQLICTLHGSGLDATHDQPARLVLDQPASFPRNPVQLRLAMAAALLASTGGSVRLWADPETVLQLAIPVRPHAIDVPPARG